jgi:hypothetical protein
VTDPNRDDTINACDPNDTIKKENCLGKIQMTKLKSCDREKSDGTAGSDGVIDTWIPAPEFSGLGTPINCDGITDIGNAAKDLVWIDVSSPEMNISKALFLPTPDKIPGLMAGTGEIAISPTVQLRIEVKLSESLQRR